MRAFLLTLSTAALIAACSSQSEEPKTTDERAVSETVTEGTTEEPILAGAEVKAPYDLQVQYDKFAEVKMTPNVRFLTESEKQVVNKLIKASGYLSEIYLRQLDVNNPKTRNMIATSDRDDKDLLVKMFDLHYGVCDSLEDNYIFFGDTPCPAGGGFYPADMTKAEFDQWIAAHPKDKAAFTSGYTVIRREGDALVAVPYHVEYKQWLEPAAKLMREAAEISENANLKKFLNLRADSFLNDKYFDSEMAWMDLDGPIEVAIGPYEVYDDGLYGYKTAYESFVTVKDPEASAALDKYKDYLRDMESNLPVEERYKNFKRGFASPIAVTDQVHGGGDNENGVQTIAFNLPNDERVREAKGAKKVILNNVLGAKYDRILAPIGKRVLVTDQARMTVKKYMSYNTLFHELSHSLGPGTITVDGAETTVNAQFKELYAAIEEGKADVMGAYNILYMMERGELPVADKQAFLATYFTGLFRSMRFGLGAAHASGAAFQYSYFREVGAVSWLPEQERFSVDFAKLEQAISDLTGDVVRLQGDGSYAKAEAFLAKYAKLDVEAETVLGKLTDIPYDIRPVYPDKI